MLLLSVVFGASSADADWINLTGAETAPTVAEITVTEGKVHVAIEIFLADLEVFEELVPDRLLKAPASDRPDIAARLRSFSRNTFRILSEDGQPLTARLRTVEPRLRKDRRSPFAGMINPITRTRVPGAPKDKRVLYVELEYAFAGRPASLTIAPPFDNAGRARVTIGFIAYHNAVPIIDFRYLSAPAKLNLDWDDPWYTRFDNPNLKRHHKSPMISALYVEPREVRHEVLLRVRDLQEWINLDLDDDQSITAAEQRRVKERASAFLATRNPLSVDGQAVKAIASRVAFLRISLTGIEPLEDRKAIDLSTAIIGVILKYPVASLPQRVSVNWDLFNARIVRVPATMIDIAGPLKTRIDAEDPVIEWQNHLLKYEEPKATPVRISAGQVVPVPVVSLMLIVSALVIISLGYYMGRVGGRAIIGIIAFAVAGAALAYRFAVVDVTLPRLGPPGQQEATRIVGGILNNISATFLERDARALRDKLAEFAAPDTVADVETEIGRALLIKVAGGGRGQIDAVDEIVVANIEALSQTPDFRALASWTAQVRAGHWGHVHRQRIRFRALMELAFRNGIWRISGLTIVDAKRVR